MFARKKTADVQTSLQRFCDLHRDAASRAKHFRLAIELLSPQDKRQLVDDFNFETFHLIDSLLLHPDLSVDAQMVFDAESALWTLEQVLCYAPELVGKGWQSNAIEAILKRALLPRNLLSVRKIAIRLFLIWYQTLAVYNNSTRTLDTVFQCCLPFFPLKSKKQTEQILQTYCESTSSGVAVIHSNNNSNFDPGPVKTMPIIVNGCTPVSPAPMTMISENMGVRERAQTLQVYLDKFLEYCCRETMKIEWSDESKHLTCSKFILDRVILLYISETFSDIENNGVDVFGGWEGSEEPIQLLDTADPIIIARYWLIRWITNIALAPFTEQPVPGLLLYRQALLSSQKATNSLLTLMREAMQLPLACSNVIQKVLTLIRCWILQRDIPPFVDSGFVSVETWNVLLAHTLLSFFKSPYLKSSGERLPAAISITHSILSIIRELANPSAGVLPRQLPKGVWAELIRCLSDSVLYICSRSDAFSSATAGVFTRTLLTVTIYIYVIREIELEDRIWDDIWLVFKTAVWTQVVEQWTMIVESTTRALILNLFAIDISQFDSSSHFCAETSSTGSSSIRKHIVARSSIIDRSDGGSTTGADVGILGNIEDDGNNYYTSQINSENGDKNNDKDINGIIQSTGNVYLWLRSWMRVINLVDPAENVQQSSQSEAVISVVGLQHQQLAVRALAQAIDVLLRCGCANVLVHWLASRLLYGLAINEQPHAIAPLCAVLTRAAEGLPAVKRAYILHNLIVGLREDEEIAQLILEHMSLMGVEELATLSSDTVTVLQKLLKSSEFSARAVKVAALLAVNYPEVEMILLSLLKTSSIELDLSSLILCINALCVVILERIDEQLLTHLSIAISSHARSKELLPIFCSNLFFLTNVGLTPLLTDVLLKAISDADTSSDISITRSTNDLKWHLCSLSAREKTVKDWRPLIESLAKHQDRFLEGLLCQKALQYPLPGFSVSQWNSQSSASLQYQQQQQLEQQNQQSSKFLESEGAILSFEKNEDHKFLWSRTVVGRHCYAVGSFEEECESESPINLWLDKLSKREKSTIITESSNFEESTQTDPFQELPRPVIRWNGLNSAMNGSSSPSISNQQTATDLAEMLHAIQKSSHSPQVLPEEKWLNEFTGVEVEDKSSLTLPLVPRNCSWRQFLSDFNLLGTSREAPQNFHRELRHLDSTMSREVHKVAVIFVGKDQEDKQSILSNNNGSDAFNAFIDGLGWFVQVGCPSFMGYSGGLPQGQIAPYFASANTEIVFHVSTILNGDATQKLKHMGNDEVHVIWSEHSKPYRRELIATRFCDVLIVLYPVTAVLVRVHIETQDLSLQFGPLFDGAFVYVKQVASLVRETVLNASRAYRNARLDCDRPNKHREKVFEQTKAHLKHLPLAQSITRLYAPLPNC